MKKKAGKNKLSTEKNKYVQFYTLVYSILLKGY